MKAVSVRVRIVSALTNARKRPRVATRGSPSFDDELAAHASGMEAAQVVIRTRLARRCERQAGRLAAGDHFDLDVQPFDDQVMEHSRIIIA